MKEPSLFLTRTRDFLRRGLEQIEASAEHHESEARRIRELVAQERLDIEAIEKTIEMIEAAKS